MKIKIRHGSPDGVVEAADMDFIELENGHKVYTMKEKEFIVDGAKVTICEPNETDSNETLGIGSYIYGDNLILAWYESSTDTFLPAIVLPKKILGPLINNLKELAK